MTFVFDIDGTICNTTDGDYENSKPILERIDIVNKLYDKGNIIYFYTARGMGRSNNSQVFAERILKKLTTQQLLDWGVKHHGLFMGKPSGEFYIDDKGVKDEEFFKNEICS